MLDWPVFLGAIDDFVSLSRLQTSGGKSVITLQKPDTLIDG